MVQNQVDHGLQHIRLEGLMVDRNKYGAIQELAGHGVSKKQIARQLEVTIKTSNHFLARREVVYSTSDSSQSAWNLLFFQSAICSG